MTSTAGSAAASAMRTGAADLACVSLAFVPYISLNSDLAKYYKLHLDTLLFLLLCSLSLAFIRNFANRVKAMETPFNNCNPMATPHNDIVNITITQKRTPYGAPLLQVAVGRNPPLVIN